MGDKVTRREFFERAAQVGVGAWAAAGAGALLWGEAAAASSPRLIIARDSAVIANGALNTARVEHLLNASVAKFVGTSSANKAWKELFSPEDVVAIKVNCVAGPAKTRPELVGGIVKSLRSAGVPDDNIIIYDRTDRELVNADFTLNRGPGVKCYGHEKDFHPKEFSAGKFRGQICRLLTDQATALINVPVLKTHGMGITCSMKNHFGSISNPGDLHPNHGDPYCGDLNTVPVIRRKTRLIVVDALWALGDGGPEARWPAGTLIVGRDTVAVDQLGWDIIEKGRKRMGLPTLEEAGRKPTYIHSAALAGLGTDDLSRMKIVQVG